MNRTDRLMAILLEFQARREVRAEDLARRFEVSVRTVYRDVQALSEGGVPIAAMPGKGYRLLDGYFLPPLTFTADEAALLALGGAFVRDRVDAGLRRAADDALAKLAGVLPAEKRAAVARRQRELLFLDPDPDEDDPRLAPLRQAIEERRVVRLLYHARRRPDPDERDVEPVSLVYLDRGWHLAAYCRLRQGPRLFRLERIDRHQPTGERFALADRHRYGPETGGDLHRFPEARVRADLAVRRWMRERQPHLFLREETDEEGPVFVYALRDERELLPWLLAWGAAIEVLAPAGLRARLAAEACALLARHADPAAPEPSPPAAMPDRTLSGALP